MLATVQSATLLGIDARPVEVEVDVSDGLPVFTIVGLPDAAVRESRERIQAAFKNSGLHFPARRVTVNLAPADERKAGTAYDLPISLALLAALGDPRDQRPLGQLAASLATGELSLDGTLRPVRGALSMALLAAERRCDAFLLPAANAREAAVVEGVRLRPVATLREALAWLGGEGPPPFRPDASALIDAERQPRHFIDLADVRGQLTARRALEVAAAGGHNLLFIGPPGSGKTMLARRLPTLLPALSLEEAMVTTRIHSTAGRLPHGRALLTERPFRAPHHTISDAGLIGGGARAQPGEISLAHQGVLFLDELPEFRRHVLEALRQPLEEGQVTVTRAMTTVRYPAAAMVVAAMNPCPCGLRGDGRQTCLCTPPQVEAYRGRISGPLLDRFDLAVDMPPVDYAQLCTEPPGESSRVVRARVQAARQRQAERLAGRADGGRLPRVNSTLSVAELNERVALPPEGHALIEQAMRHFKLSARAYDRVRRVARTIADLEESEAVSTVHLAEAIQYRRWLRG